ncbi:MAG TPA: hypothetical protein VGU68_14595 [Ktedonobacteraceae bacterium]|nr:hypothetical protein [Ktedonobacteraceae bacterium]
MSRQMHIFVDTEESLEDFIQMLESLLGMSAHLHSEDREVWYELQNASMFFSVGTHEYVNDRDMLFESYLYDIEMSVTDIKDGEERLRRLKQVARSLFDTLKQSQHYQLMLVDDLQVKLDEFHSRGTMP